MTGDSGDPGLVVTHAESGRNSESEEEEMNDKRQKIDAAVRTHVVGTSVKSENLDPMIEPIDGQRKVCAVKRKSDGLIVGDDIEEDMEQPVNRQSMVQQVEQSEVGVQYSEADLLPQQPGDQVTQLLQSDSAVKTDSSLKTELVYAPVSDQTGQFISESGAFIAESSAGDNSPAAGLITESYIDASSNHLVMSDGALVSLVSDQAEQGEQEQQNIVNIVTSTATNEQGQQIIIIDNLDQHSPELQREIMNALLADHTIVPISQ